MLNKKKLISDNKLHLIEDEEIVAIEDTFFLQPT